MLTTPASTHAYNILPLVWSVPRPMAFKSSWKNVGYVVGYVGQVGEMLVKLINKLEKCWSSWDMLVLIKLVKLEK